MRQFSRVGGALRQVSPLPSAAKARDPVLHVNLAAPGAKVMLLPGRFRDAAFIRSHVDYVLGLSADRGEQHVQRNLRAVRRTLEEMGVGSGEIKTELKRIEAAVRAELWRRVLLPGGDA